jgi:hypothetical protein
MARKNGCPLSLNLACLANGKNGADWKKETEKTTCKPAEQEENQPLIH